MNSMPFRTERRRLPWVRIEKPYVFEGPDGDRTLEDLFEGRSQLAVYHFMLKPDSDHVCKGCSFVADHFGRRSGALRGRRFVFLLRSRVHPWRGLSTSNRYWGWAFPWFSSRNSDFNYDFGVSFRKEDLEAGRATYNYGTIPIRSEDMMGTSIFARSGTGEVFHTYSAFARGIENLMGAFMWEDLTPKGRHNSMNGRSRLSEDGLRDSRQEDCDARSATCDDLKMSPCGEPLKMERQHHD